MYSNEECIQAHIRPDAYCNATETGLNIEIIPPVDMVWPTYSIKITVPGSFSQERILWVGVQAVELIESGYRMSDAEALGGAVGEDLTLTFTIDQE